LEFLSENPNPDLPGTNTEVITYVFEELRKEFVGFDSIDGQTNLETTNIHRIFNLRICDMCQLESFICEFRKYYYSIHSLKRIEHNLLGLFYNKLPPAVGTKMEKIFQEKLNTVMGMENTLGARITALRQWMSEQCIDKITKREAQINLCCNRLQDKVGNYGCNRSKRKRKRKRKRKVFRKIDRSE
jgi:hypothetical protein